MKAIYIYSKENDICAIVGEGTEGSLESLGFEVSDASKRKCGQFINIYAGLKNDYYSVTINIEDLEFFVKSGFVRDVEKLPEKENLTNVDSSDASNASTGNSKPKQRSASKRPKTRKDSV